MSPIVETCATPAVIVVVLIRWMNSSARSMAETDGVALYCHVLNALGVNDTGKDDGGRCAISSLSAVPLDCQHM